MRIRVGDFQQTPTLLGFKALSIYMVPPAMGPKTFRTIPNRDHRAMAGLSMGGMQTFQVTFDHLNLFSFIGGFSGAANVFMMGNNKLDTKTAYHGAMADPAAFAKRVHLL